MDAVQRDSSSKQLQETAPRFVRRCPLRLRFPDCCRLSGALCEFGGMRFTLLWRRDGLGARHFHWRCNGHAPTLALIHDRGEYFRGFTRVVWKSQREKKVDASLKSFRFTLKNPHNFPARKYALKAEEKDHTTYYDSWYGSCFYGISVFDHCNADTRSYSSVGRSSANTGLDGKAVLRGS
jgi:hypothetical protein